VSQRTENETGDAKSRHKKQGDPEGGESLERVIAGVIHDY
jgi:hypothetical protein